MNVDDSINAINELDRKDDYQIRQTEAEIKFANDFLELCAKGDVNAVADFAKPTFDYRSPIVNGKRGTRPQTLDDLMGTSLDYTKGPQQKELYQLLLNVAFGKSHSREACELLNRMAETLAVNSVQVDE